MSDPVHAGIDAEHLHSSTPVATSIKQNSPVVCNSQDGDDPHMHTPLTGLIVSPAIGHEPTPMFNSTK